MKKIKSPSKGDGQRITQPERTYSSVGEMVGFLILYEIIPEPKPGFDRKLVEMIYEQGFNKFLVEEYNVEVPMKNYPQYLTSEIFLQYLKKEKEQFERGKATWSVDRKLKAKRKMQGMSIAYFHFYLQAAGLETPFEEQGKKLSEIWEDLHQLHGLSAKRIEIAWGDMKTWAWDSKRRQLPSMKKHIIEAIEEIKMYPKLSDALIFAEKDLELVNLKVREPILRK